MIAATSLAILAVSVPCVCACLMFPDVEARPSHTPTWFIAVVDASPALVPVAVASACVAVCLWMVAGRLARRIDAPLPAPDADPLASYRDGAPHECLRHPFAKPPPR